MRAAHDLCSQGPLSMGIDRIAHSRHDGLCFAYLALSQGEHLTPKNLLDLQALWTTIAPELPLVQMSRLELVLQVEGCDDGKTPLHHYVVETDPETGWEEEIFRWYDQEHMPGLAAVPGCTLAQRMINHDAGPRSHACYGLLREHTLGSPPWLAVRGTEWSSRCRPHFTNTRRTMFNTLKFPMM